MKKLVMQLVSTAKPLALDRQIDQNLPAVDADEDDQLLFLLSRESIALGANTKQTLDLVNTLNKQCLHLHQLEDSLSTLIPAILEQQPELLAHIHEVESTLEQVSRLMQPLSLQSDLRAQLVTVLNLAIDFWCSQTRGNKVELAHQSGEWKIYVNDDGWGRTQTLDRYLSLETLPKRPRWKQVIRTAEFVLAHCQAESVERNQLQNELAALRVLS